jgi:transcriptional regulator with XRE-family HTH domain
MIIGDRLREPREQKQFTQGEIAKRTGLLRLLHLPSRMRPHDASRGDT